MVEKSHTAGRLKSLYEPLRQFGERIADWFAPQSDASATEDEYEINIELPGVKDEDVDVSIDGDNLTIRGEKKVERKETGKSYFFSEREFGSFYRSFKLPPDAIIEKIDARFNDGVLTLKIPKKEAKQPSERKIEIKKN